MIKADNLSFKFKNGKAFIVSISYSNSTLFIRSGQSGDYLLRHCADKLSPRSLTLTRKLFSHPSIFKRHFAIEDIKHWALHTGGDKIINTIKSEMGLSEMQLRAIRKVLSEYGNMSSPTVWFVLDEILKEGIKKGDWCIMVAFGAGLSAHAFLLRKS